MVMVNEVPGGSFL